MGRTGQRRGEARQEHVEHGVRDVPVHARRRAPAHHPRPLRAGRLLRRGGQQAVQDSVGLFASGTEVLSVAASLKCRSSVWCCYIGYAGFCQLLRI